MDHLITNAIELLSSLWCEIMTGNMYHKCSDGTYPIYDIMTFDGENWMMYPNRDMEIPVKYCYNCGAKL